MNQVGTIDFKKIKRISPSQLYSLKSCAYKSLLAEAMNKKALLPVSANAYYGIVLHKMLELISKGKIRSEDDFNISFQEQIKLMEEKLIEDCCDYFIPLQKNVKDFTMKKILLKDHFQIYLSEPRRGSIIEFHTEKWYESKDKLIGGKIDLVIESENEIEIIDFKTGEITQDVLDNNGYINTEIKTEYKEQLKLYAYLYFENTGRFPTKLSLVDLAKKKFTVEFSKIECSNIFEEAKSLLTSTNNCVDTGIFTANPTKVNCKYCLYRPACSFYSKHIETENSFNDVSGSIQNVTMFQNGNVSLYLLSGDKKYTVSNFPREKYDEFSKCINKKVNIFNLKKESRDYFYSAIKTTIIYE